LLSLLIKTHHERNVNWYAWKAGERRLHGWRKLLWWIISARVRKLEAEIYNPSYDDRELNRFLRHSAQSM
jgi:hypothetical protein